MQEQAASLSEVVSVFKLDTSHAAGAVSATVKQQRPAVKAVTATVPAMAPRKLASAARSSAPADEWESF
ncbi:hypothetical protein D3C87_2085090 [compost metagenome]